MGASLAAARSVYGQLAAQALTLDLSGPPPKVPGRLASPKVNASFIGEGQPIPVRSLALTSITLGPKKLGVLSTFTDELRKMSQPNVEEVLRSEITADTASAVDAVLLDADPATSIRPAGLLNGVAALPAAAAGVTAMQSDVAALLNAVAPGSRVALIAPIGQAAALAAHYGSEVVAVIGAGSVPSRVVLAIDLDAFASASDLPAFDLSTETLVHEEDTLPLPVSATGSPATVAASPAAERTSNCAFRPSSYPIFASSSRRVARKSLGSGLPRTSIPIVCRFDG